MIDDIDDTCKIFAHVCFDIVWAVKKLRNTIVKVGCDDSVQPAFFVIFIKFGYAICKQTVGCADEYTSCLTLFQLTGNIQHTLSGRDHIVDDDNILAFYRVAKEFMSYDRILSVDYSGVIAAFIEHTHINSKNIGKIYST